MCGSQRWQIRLIISFALAGEGVDGNCHGGRPHLLRALSDYTKIKELHIKDLRRLKPSRGFARLLLESMLNLLSGPALPAFFPSLRMLKVTIAKRDYGREEVASDYIDSLLLTIKAMRPPNLKIIILEDENNKKRLMF